MKKLAIAAAVAAAGTFSAGTHAARPVNVVFANGVEIFINNVPLVVPCQPGTPVFTVDGASAGSVQMQGGLCLDVYGTGDPFVKLTFNSVTGPYSSTPPAGTVFNAGTIAIDVQTTNGYLPYGAIDVTTNNINCLSGQTGHLGSPQVTAGLQVASGTNPLPGIWDIVSNANVDSAVCVTSLLGQNTGLFMKGNITAP